MFKNFRKSALLSALAIVLIGFSACEKDPEPELPQEEVGSAKLIFTEVHWHHDHADDIDDPDIVEITFNEQGIPPAGLHVHLEEGATYRLELIAYDFANREIQQEFLNSADEHQAFILGAPEGVIDYVYADDQVGVTGYLHALEHTESDFVFNYVLRHLRPGVKASITAADWNNPNYTQFTGSNDLDLKFELHIVEHGDHDH